MRARADGLDVSTVVEGRLVEVPVCYGGDLGPDLADVAAFAGCSEADVIAAHTGRDYRVYMVGFVPGFAYMAEVEPRIAAPRRSTPRMAVPTGSVAIAGGQTGVYPAATPGGWNIIGRTAGPALRSRQGRTLSLQVWRQGPFSCGVAVRVPAVVTPALTVTRPGMLTTVQDLGRWGAQSNGVPVAGPMDEYSHVLANRLVGNPPSAAALEVTLIGPELLANTEVTCAVAGATFALTRGTVPFPCTPCSRCGRGKP